MNRSEWLALSLVLCFASSAAAGRRVADSDLSYEAQVRPILKANCFECHGEGEKLKGGLDLRLRRLMVTGGKSGPAIEPGKRDESLLYERIRKGEMPPGTKKLTVEEVALIGRWIAAGAKTAGPEPKKIDHGFVITEAERNYWAFQPIRRPAVTSLDPSARVRTPIDAFIAARLQATGLTLLPEADSRTLIRRAYFDLVGLPPTPKEVDQFVADPRPCAYELLIDRLLASPRYGERWGRHWLDVAGYADSEGYTNDDPIRPHAYKYRDYVIRSFNADQPFDQFIREQLAGDELIRPPYQNLTPGDIDKLVATGFLRMAPDGTGSRGVDQDVARNQVIAETIKIVSSSLLGLTVGCAQCHNHRYDPIPQTDYYRLRAIFEPAYDWKNWRAPQARRISLYSDGDRRKSQEIEAEAAKIDRERLKKQQEYIERTFQKELKKLPANLCEPIRIAWQTPPAQRTAEQSRLLKQHPSVNVTAGSLYLYDNQAAEDLKRFAARAAAVRATKPVEDFVRALTEVPGRVPTTYLFHRGDLAQPKQAVAPGGLVVLDRTDPFQLRKEPSLPTAGRRLAFACWLTDGKHPLTARVLVNRIWMHHFGRGLVSTPADFGRLGERPTHPELLDWLASEFMAGGWRLKPLHKLIMTSTAYRQSSRRGPAADRIDPDNRLLWRMPVRRLEAEAIRDSILAVSGKLNSKMFGPSVPVMEDEVGQFVLGIENKNGENRPGPVIALHGEEFRRSVYVQVRRSRPFGVLDTFDEPAMEPNCAARNASTVTPQALMFMNSDFVVMHAGYFAERVRREAGHDSRAQIALAWRLAFACEPTTEQAREAVAFLVHQATIFATKKSVAGKPDPQLQALANFCQTLLSANQFLYVD